MLTSGVTKGLTTIVISLLTAVAGEAQLAFEVKVTRIRSPFSGACEMVDDEPGKVVQGPPAMLLSHRKVGTVPPFMGSAVKVTEVPLQTLLPELMLTAGVTGSFTVMVMMLLVVVAGQSASAVISTVTLSLFARVVELKVLLVAPETGKPFMYH